jgi:hypothetical protein
MKNYKLLMEVMPYGQVYETLAGWEYYSAANFFLFTKIVKNLSVGCKSHLSFIANHLQFIIRKGGANGPGAAGESGKGETTAH